ncbi:hypothetical protein [Microbacterium sp. CFBP9034]|uniref:hypothetical protein n=1 Tax=Microbacterium sp. CFBP9034 TaxID=3096540 RepID=UPI002A6AEAA4|nr:hypothetical protein [Microbacterium sp. CFBP9034]MDY0907951.1 hypothetical protein [Microbacterium sp. CFBP9034]
MGRSRTAKRGVVVAVLALGALALAGCASNPDLTGLESDLGQVDGVNGAFVWPTHSGAPWNTQVQVMLFLDDSSDDAVVEAVRGSAAVIAADAEASRHDVTISFVDGDRADYADRSDASAAEISVMPPVYEALGLPEGSVYAITLRPEDVRAIAGGE